MLACCHAGHFPITKLLLERGANVNAVNDYGYTALDSACLKGSKDCVEELLAHGADATIKNKDGKTPLDVAQQNKHQSIIDLLTEHKKPEHHLIDEQLNQYIVDLLTEHKKRLKQPITDSVQDAKKSTMSEEYSLKGKVPESVLVSSSEEQLSSKVESIIDRRCEELRRDVMNLECKVETIIDRRCKEMNQSFEALTRQLTMSNAEVVKCVSNLSTIVGHLSSKVSHIEGRLDSKEDGQCAELCDTSARTQQERITQSLQRTVCSDGTASNDNTGAFDGEKKKDTVEDFEIV
jgi:hypothetical protein